MQGFCINLQLLINQMFNTLKNPKIMKIKLTPEQIKELTKDRVAKLQEEKEKLLKFEKSKFESIVSKIESEFKKKTEKLKSIEEIDYNLNDESSIIKPKQQRQAISKELAAKIRELFEAGNSASLIGNQLGIDSKRIQNKINSMKLKRK